MHADATNEPRSFDRALEALQKEREAVLAEATAAREANTPMKAGAIERALGALKEQHSELFKAANVTREELSIDPGKVTDAPCFRIGNIGNLTVEDMEHLLRCIKTVLADMDIPVPVS